MPSFDVVSEVDLHELTNAVDQTRREIGNRFDFKGTGAKVEQADWELTLVAEAEFQINQMLDILRNKMAKRGIDLGCLQVGEMLKAGKETRLIVTARRGIDKELAKRIVKLVKDSKIKLQAAIQGEQVRVSGKKRDDLQSMMKTLREGNFELPLQFVNFRD